jgi:2-keto-4-pentenoate hydratase/2-oxohepta-3-ene-1,7-dioic acid hydratase in catechol pathway
LLSLGQDATDALVRAPSTRARRLLASEAHLVAPVPRPPSFLAIARNYAAHIEELGHERPEFQTWFSKQPTCVVGPGQAIEVPLVSASVDYEGELGMVIGRRCRHVPAQQALEVVAGFTVVNDVSARDWQWRSPTMMMGKGFDTHGPTGPWIVTADEVRDPQRLTVRTWVNGELRQDGITSDMIFTCAQMIEHLSAAFTLEPGMLITTGTPAGVAAGEDPPRWLAAGDTVTVAIEGVGELTNPVIDEPARGGDDPGGS